jgi:hypothetical protein
LARVEQFWGIFLNENQLKNIFHLLHSATIVFGEFTIKSSNRKKYKKKEEMILNWLFKLLPLCMPVIFSLSHLLTSQFPFKSKTT